MDIQGTLTADLVKVGIQHDNSNDGNTMVLDTEVTVDQEQCAKHFEEDFVAACFAGIHKAEEVDEEETTEVWRFPYSTIQPPRWAVCQVHKVDLWGHKDELQPEVRKITAGNKAAVVTIALRFKVPVGDDAELIGGLGCKVGGTVKVKLAPKNPKLPLKERDAASATGSRPTRSTSWGQTALPTSPPSAST